MAAFFLKKKKKQRGTVQKIIRSFDPGAPEKVQIGLGHVGDLPQGIPPGQVDCCAKAVINWDG